MTTRLPSSSLNPWRLNRRQMTLGIGTVALGAALGVQGIRRGTLAASGQLPGANLVELATYAGWRGTWDLIVPLSTQRLFPRPFLLYDRSAGEATLIAVDAFGGYREVRTYFDWRTTWDVLIPSGFPGISGVTGLFALRSGRRVHYDLPDRCLGEHRGVAELRELAQDLDILLALWHERAPGV